MVQTEGASTEKGQIHVHSTHVYNANTHHSA